MGACSSHNKRKYLSGKSSFSEDLISRNVQLKFWIELSNFKGKQLRKVDTKLSIEIVGRKIESKVIYSKENPDVFR